MKNLDRHCMSLRHLRLTNSSFKLRLDGNASASGLLTSEMCRPSRHLPASRGSKGIQGTSAAGRGAIRPGRPILTLCQMSDDVRC